MLRHMTAVLLASSAALLAQVPPATPLVSEPGPTFSFPDTSLPASLTLILYGDQRFTDPANVVAADPTVRAWLAKQIALENPAAILLNGDIPLDGDVAADYTVFQSESKPWRDAKIRVFPSIGNHELHGDQNKAMNNWWTNFPELKNRRWYSAQLGSRVYILALDSNSSLVLGSDQAKWLEKQIDDLPPSIDFVFVTMHHPPVADIQQHIEVDHNPRENEIALRTYLSRTAAKSHARFLVSAGHIHNYERHVVDNVVYLVAGGGGARPYYVERTPDDLYQSVLFPNFHYVKVTVEKDRLRGAMYRVADPEAPTLSLQLKDTFEIPANPR
jgi:acid phosphatase type 7